MPSSLDRAIQLTGLLISTLKSSSFEIKNTLFYSSGWNKQMSAKVRLSILVTAAILCITSTAFADKLCLQSTVNKKTLKVTNKSVVAAKCPKGYTVLADTSSFQGPAGAQGATGARGPSAFDTIPSGTTVTGFMAQGEIARTDDSVWVFASIPAKIPTPLVDNKVIITANSVLLAGCGSINCLAMAEQVDNGLCTGTFENPTAPAGYVCIYLTDVPLSISPQSLQGVGLINNAPQGFAVYYVTSFDGYTSLEGTWAYTAP
jgi:hypothetical protein